jgi:hypothetical protein
MKKHTWGKLSIITLIGVLIAAFGLSSLFSPAAEARAAVQSVWRNARVAGGYTFRADITQRVVPLASLSNIGRTSRDYQYHIEGTTDLSARALDLKLWDHGGSVLDPSGAAQLKIVDGVASMRRGDQPWQPVDDFSASFAPSGDFMAFLSGASDVVSQGQETRNGTAITRYTFALDGPGYARFVRDQLQARMAQQGKLPKGVQLDLPATYKGMTGTGELWVRSDGLPLRQIIMACRCARSSTRSFHPRMIMASKRRSPSTFRII